MTNVDSCVTPAAIKEKITTKPKMKLW